MTKKSAVQKKASAINSQISFNALKIQKLNNKKNKIFQQAMNGWGHTLKMWGYWNKIDLVMRIILFISGTLLGIGIGGGNFK